MDMSEMAMPSQFEPLSEREAQLVDSVVRRCRRKSDAFLTRMEKQAAQLPGILAWQNGMMAEIKMLRAQISAGNVNANAATASSSRDTARSMDGLQTALPQCHATHATLQSDQQCTAQQYAQQKAKEQLMADLHMDRLSTDATCLQLFNQQLRARAEKIQKHVAKRTKRRQNRQRSKPVQNTACNIE